ncbi:MAG: AMP-binding protein, partial [Novosphingobium sp.]
MPQSPDPTVYPLDHLAVRGMRDAPALVLKNATLSYEALNARVGSLAIWLKSRVAEEGARIATWLPKTELACLMPLAAVRAGLVHVPINPLLKRAQVAHILADSGAALLVSNKARLESLEQGDADCAVIEEAQAWVEVEAGDGGLPPSNAAPDSLAAILY